MLPGRVRRGGFVIAFSAGLEQRSGGPGADRFVWFSLNSGTDIIRDFEPGPQSDVLDLPYAVTLPGGESASDYPSLAADGYNTLVLVDHARRRPHKL